MQWFSRFSPSRYLTLPRRLSATLGSAVLLAVVAIVATTSPAAQAHPATASRGLRCTQNCYQDGYFPGFFHKATATNSDFDYTILDNLYTDAQPGEILMVSQFWNYPQGSAGVFNDHNIGVWFDTSLQQWTVFNEDGSDIPMGASFSVVAQSPSSTAFTMTTTASTISGDYALINSSVLNGNPAAQVFVTPVFGSTAMVNNHPVGVWYTGSQWAVFNEDRASMQPGEMFNIVLTFPTGSVCFLQTANSSNIVGDSTELPDSEFSASGGVAWATPDWGTSGPFLNHPIGIYISGLPWNSPNAVGAIFDEDSAAMVSGAKFFYCELSQ